LLAVSCVVMLEPLKVDLRRQQQRARRSAATVAYVPLTSQ
jgi:hypothetical protein